MLFLHVLMQKMIIAIFRPDANELKCSRTSASKGTPAHCFPFKGLNGQNWLLTHLANIYFESLFCCFNWQNCVHFIGEIFQSYVKNANELCESGTRSLPRTQEVTHLKAYIACIYVIFSLEMFIYQNILTLNF